MKLVSRADASSNETAIRIFNRSIIVGMNSQIDGVLEVQTNQIIKRLRKELDRLYVDFARDLVAAIGNEGPTEAVSKGGVSYWAPLSENYFKRKQKTGRNPPSFFHYNGDLLSHFRSFNVKKVFGTSIINRGGGGRGLERNLQKDTQGRLRIKAGTTIGSQKGGQFVKDLRNKIFTITPEVFPLSNKKNQNNINLLFPRYFAWRLWNRSNDDGRPYRPLVWPILRFYKTTKLDEALKRAIR